MNHFVIKRNPNCSLVSPTWVAITLLLCSVIQTSLAQLVPNLGGQRSGISALQFLKIGADPRGVAMGEACVAVSDDIGAIFWNPAGLVNSQLNQAMFSHAEWLVDIKHEFSAASYHLDPADVVAVSFISLRTDPMKITTVFNPTGTGEYFNYSDLAVGVTYSRRMTDQFSFGVTAKYVQESIAEIHTTAIVVDIGTYYSMGLGSSRFSVVVSNFGNNVRPNGDVVSGKGYSVTSFQDFSPPTLFKLGYAFEPYQDDKQKLTASIQLNHPNDNAENIRLGFEYGFNQTFFLRAGVKRTIGESLFGKSSSAADDFSLGAGVIIPLEITNVNFDYAFTNFNELGAVHRVSIAVTY